MVMKLSPARAARSSKEIVLDADAVRKAESKVAAIVKDFTIL